MECLKCGKILGPEDTPRAGISIFVMGDEYIYTYVRCSSCGEYTVEAYHDRFMGEDDVTTFTVSRETGEKAIELIKACPAPYDKWCECDSHKALYYGFPRE